MGEIIRIGTPEGAPGLGATIDTTGAWVTELSIRKDHIFFPRDLVATESGESKFRGGGHICSPYFGPDPRGVGSQHGYGREVEWDTLQVGSRYVRLQHIQRGGDYDGLTHNLGMQVVDLGALQMFIVNLSLSSQGTENMYVAPGMHPYLGGRDKYNECHPQAKRDTRSREKENYSARDIELASGLIVRMTTVNLPNFTAWSDNANEYHCIEPSVKSLDDSAENTELLLPGQSRSFTVSMKIMNPALAA